MVRRGWGREGRLYEDWREGTVEVEEETTLPDGSREVGGNQGLREGAKIGPPYRLPGSRGWGASKDTSLSKCEVSHISSPRLCAWEDVNMSKISPPGQTGRQRQNMQMTVLQERKC